MPVTGATAPDLETVAARAAERDHDPAVYWPGLDRAAFDRAIDAIIATAGRVLRGERGVPLAALGADAATHGRAAFRLGVGPLIGHWIATGAVAAREALGAVFATHLEHGRRRHARLVGELGRLRDALGAAGIEAGVLKGPDVARYYPEPGARAFMDIDLFVTPADADGAAAVLGRLGFEGIGLVEGKRQDWTLPGQQLQSLDLTHAGNPWNVDLHWRFTRTYHRALEGRLPDIDPRDCPSAVIGNTAVPVLPDAMRIAFTALHASNTIRTLLLSQLVDLVLLARATAPHGSPVWTELLALLARSGSSRFAYPPLVLAEHLAPGAVPTPVLEELGSRVARRLRRTTARLPLTGLAPPDRWRVRSAMMWVETPRDAWLVLRQAIKPGRFRTLRQHLSLARRAVLGLLRGLGR